MKKLILAAVIGVLTLSTSATTTLAQEVSLRLHHFMPPPATLSAHYFIPWAEEMAAKSDGRLAIELYAAMSLGGTPGDLVDQAIESAFMDTKTLTDALYIDDRSAHHGSVGLSARRHRRNRDAICGTSSSRPAPRRWLQRSKQ